MPTATPVKLAWTLHPAVAAAAPRIAAPSPLSSPLLRPTLRPTPHGPSTTLPPQPIPERVVVDEVPMFSRLFPLCRVAARTIAREIRIASPVGSGAYLNVVPPALLLRLDIGLVEVQVPFSSGLFGLPRILWREVRMASPAGAGAPLEVVPPALLLSRNVGLVEVEVPFSSGLFGLSQAPSQEMRIASPAEAGAPLDVIPPVLLRCDLGSVEVEVPFSSGLFRLSQAASQGIQIAAPAEAGAALDVIPAALLSGCDLAKNSARTLPGAGLLTLAMPQVPLVHGTLVLEGKVENLGGAQRGIPSEASRSAVSTPPLYPQPKMAEGQRYGVEFRGSLMRSPLREPCDCMALPADIALPQAPETLRENCAPESAGLAALGFRAQLKAVSQPAKPAVTRLAGIPQPLCSGPVRPWSKLEPLDGKPVADVVKPEAPSAGIGFSGMGMPLPEKTPTAKVPVWAHAAGFWKHAPRDLKLLMFASPALLALAFHPALPKVAVAAAPKTGEMKRSITTVVSGELANVRRVVYDRAAVALDEDFRSGLDEWASKGDAKTRWSFDATGFVKPGPLALYRPSMGLTDYEEQFLGMIDQKALSWVVRAVDFNNYYVVKLVVLKPGPQTTVGITRYAVIDGKPQDRVDTAVPLDARVDTLYRVLLNVRGDDFTLTIQGQMVDNWTDTRLRHGGIGFFTARGEESRVRWVQVTHQYDMLGRLCAYLAPYEIPTTNGSW